MLGDALGYGLGRIVDSDAVGFRPFAGKRVEAGAGTQKGLHVRHLIQRLWLEAEVRPEHPADLGVAEVRKQFLRRLAALRAEVGKCAYRIRSSRRKPLLARRHETYIMAITHVSPLLCRRP